MLNTIETSILATIVYYDVLGIPLTSFEIWKYLVNLKRFGLFLEQKPQLKIVIDSLENGKLKNFIEEKDGFYFLNGKSRLVEERIKRQKRSIEAIKKFRKYLKLFAAVPFVRLISLSGSLSLYNLDENSDWDPFFIIKKERLYFTSLIITFLVLLLNKRRSKIITKDKICLNHFIADRNLNIRYHSLYTAQLLQRMILIYDESISYQNGFFENPAFLSQKHSTSLMNSKVFQKNDGIYSKFAIENNWILDYFYFGMENQEPLIKLSKFLKFIKYLLEKILQCQFFNLFENLSKKIRIRRSQRKYNLPGRIIVDEFQIEYHPDSPEFKIINEYNKKMRELGFENLAKEKNSGLKINWHLTI